MLYSNQCYSILAERKEKMMGGPGSMKEQRAGSIDTVHYSEELWSIKQSVVSKLCGVLSILHKLLLAAPFPF